MSKETFKVTQDNKNSGLYTCTVIDDFSLNNNEEIVTKLNKIVDNCKELTFNVKNIETIDLSAIQLIYSIKKTCAGKSKKINIQFEVSEEIKQLIKNSGFDDLLTN